MIEDKFLPEGFKALICDEIGEKRAEILFSALCREPETSVRVNRHKAPKELLYPDMTPVPWCHSGSYLIKRPSFTHNPLLHAGVFYVQDASSMIYESIIESLVKDGSPISVCDLCAAPGGKTTAIMNALPDGSVMLANEFSTPRSNILKENLSKYGNPEVIVTNADTSRLSEMKGKFNIIAVDAPCSGEGMMRKEEVARNQWNEGLIRQCASLQREILKNAAEMLAPGGYLIYSTCTFNTTEDEDNAAWIADTLGLLPIDTNFAGKDGIQCQVKGDIPCLRFIPGFTRGEGLFLSVFRKPEEISGSLSTRSAIKKGKKENAGNHYKTDPRILEMARSWIKGDMKIINRDGRLLALSTSTSELLEQIPKGVRIISAGIEIGEIKGKDLIPAHDLAMSTVMARPFPEVELTKDEALRYLSKEAISLPAETPKGFVTATYNGFPIGFLKNLGNRANNLYPGEWRIRVKSSE
ncbi:MAG: RsmB/NOP family class I SAM-dependent RNA methyltransferase [Muribaculaceae bacterium]|nr:RsmB/NOP family class I SAM-dependent RNA methyltransferase [Muribaculaceae bacterium]